MKITVLGRGNAGVLTALHYSAYTQNFDNEQHEQLALELQKVRGKFALSYYHFDKLEEWYPKSKFRYVTKSFNKQNSTKKKNTDRGDEILIMNY